MSNSEKYEFFWNGPFSQWYPSQFTIEDNTFCTAEQWMMYSKAKLFGDDETAKKILVTANPKEQKALGRQVKEFDAMIWNKHAQNIVYEGNLAKFTQNPSMLMTLMDTGTKILVEASPYDKIWGIGMSEEQAKVTPESEWDGSNWLGKVLTQVKFDLRAQEK